MVDTILSYCWNKSVLLEYAREALFFDWLVMDNIGDTKLLDLAMPGLCVL